jgi:hypothetical protein
VAPKNPKRARGTPATHLISTASNITKTDPEVLVLKIY